MRFAPQTEVKIIRNLAHHLAQLESGVRLSSKQARNITQTVYGRNNSSNRPRHTAVLNYVNYNRKILAAKIAAGDFTPIQQPWRKKVIALVKKHTASEHASRNSESNNNNDKMELEENKRPSTGGQASDSNFVQVQHSEQSSNSLTTQSSEGMNPDNHDGGITVVDKPDNSFGEEKFHGEYMIPDYVSEPQPIVLISNSTASFTEPSKMNRDYIDSVTPLVIAADVPQQEAFRREYMIPDDFFQSQHVAFKDDSIQARKAKLCMEIVELTKRSEMEISRFQETMANLRSQQREKEKMLQNLLLQ